MPGLAERSKAHHERRVANDNTNQADRPSLDRQTEERGHGVGSESALARLKNIERERQRVNLEG